MGRLWVVGVVMTVAGLGCGDDGGGDLSGKLDAMFALQDHQVDLECACFDEGEYDSESACLTGEKDGSATRKCFLNALEEEEDVKDALDYLDCVLASERKHTQCLDAAMVCEEADASEECNDGVDSHEACKKILAPSTRSAIEDCYEDE
jgi:hypothetical protein